MVGRGNAPGNNFSPGRAQHYPQPGPPPYGGPNQQPPPYNPYGVPYPPYPSEPPPVSSPYPSPEEQKDNQELIDSFQKSHPPRKMRDRIPDPRRGLPPSAWFWLLVGLVVAALVGMDVLVPTEPVELPEAGSLTGTGEVTDVAVAGDFAYLSDTQGGLRILNVSVPTAPRTVGYYNGAGNALAVAVSGDYAYLANYDEGLRVIDVGNPASPRGVGHLNEIGDVEDVMVAGDFAYVVCRYDGLKVIEIEDPTAPRLSGEYYIGSGYQSVEYAGGLAYVTTGYDSLYIIDVGNPQSPAGAGYYGALTSAQGVAVVDDQAYVADGSSGLRVLNVSNSTAPSEVASLGFDGEAGDVTVAGDYAYVVEYGTGLRIIDVSDPTNLSEVANFATLGEARSVVVVDGYAYVASGSRGLRIIDVRDPTGVHGVGRYDTLGEAWNVAVAGDFAYVADGDGGLVVLNISDPAAPSWVGGYDTTGDTLNVAVAGDYAYVADGSAGLAVLNVSDPAAPSWVGGYDTTGYAYVVAVAGDYAYVADGESGLVVINLSNPTDPQLAGSNDTGYAHDVAVVDGYAYVAADTAGLVVVDVSDAANLHWAGLYDTAGHACGVAVAGGYAYVADYDGGLVVIDMNDPANPVFAGGYDTSNDVRDVTVFGNYAYAAVTSPVGDIGSWHITDAATDSERESASPTHAMWIGNDSKSTGEYDNNWDYSVFTTDSFALGDGGLLSFQNWYETESDYDGGNVQISTDDGESWGVIHPNGSYPDNSISGLDSEPGYTGTSSGWQSVSFDLTGYSGEEVSFRYRFGSDGSYSSYEGWYFDDVELRDNGGVIFTDDFEWPTATHDWTVALHNGGGVVVVDVSDQTRPVLVGGDDTTGEVTGVTVSDSYVYLANHDNGVRIIDVSDPVGPREIGSYDAPDDAYAMAVSGGLTYMADGENGLRILNLSDPAAPREVGYYTTVGSAREVAVVGGYAYVACGEEGVEIIDVSDPAAPRRVGRYDSPGYGYAYGMAVEGAWLYVADGGNGLRIVNVSNPANPVESPYIGLSGNTYDVVVVDDYAYAIAHTTAHGYMNGEVVRLSVLNVSDPAQAYEIDYHEIPGEDPHFTVADGYAYVVNEGNDETDRLRIIDISNPQVITEMGDMHLTGDSATDVTVSDGYACVVNEDGLWLIDVRDPSDPQEVGYSELPSEARGVAVVDGYIHVADGEGGLRIIALALDEDGDGYPLGEDAFPTEDWLHERSDGVAVVLGVTVLLMAYSNHRDKKKLRRRVGPEVKRLMERVAELNEKGLPHDIHIRYLKPARKAARGRRRMKIYKAVTLVEQGLAAAKIPEHAAETIEAARSVLAEARAAGLYMRSEALEAAEEEFAALNFEAAEAKAEALRRTTETQIHTNQQAREELTALHERLAGAEKAIDTTSLRSLPSPAEQFLEMNDPEAALEHLRGAAKSLEQALEKWVPNLVVELPNELVAGRWIRTPMEIRNEGKAHTRNLQVTLDGIKCKRIPPIKQLRAGAKQSFEVALLSGETGSLPVRVSLRAERCHDGKTISAETSVWLEVVGTSTAEPTLPPSSRHAAKPRRPKPVAEWKPPKGLKGDEAVLADYFGLRWKAYQAAPNNEPLLDELHNRRAEFAISSYFEVPTSPSDMLHGWALPPNLRGNVHLDTVRADIVEAVGCADAERNFVVIGEPGVGKTALLFELFDRLLASGPAGLLTTSALGNAHLRFGFRLFYDDIPENLELVEAIAARKTRGLVVTAREADWQNLPAGFQKLFDRLTVPLFPDDEMGALCRKMLTFSGLGYEAPAVELLVSYAGGSPIYVWSLVRELMHSGLRTLSRTYIQEHATKGMANYVAMLLQRLLKDGKKYREGGLHALTCLVFLAEYMDERQCHDLYFRAVADAISDHTEEKLDDGLHLMTFNHAMSYLAGEGAVVRFPHDTWVDVLGGAGSLNPFRAEIHSINAAFADSDLFEQLKREAVPEAWSTVAARYRRNPSRQKDSFLLLADTLLRNFTLSQLEEYEVDIDLVREVASAYSHLPLAAILVSKLQAARPTQVTKIINIQDSVISRSTIGGGGDAKSSIRDSLFSRKRKL